MQTDVELIEATRGGRVECVHRGHVVVCDSKGEITFALGDPSANIFPRSACKMLQALPMVESGAAKSLRQDQLALSCASHIGAAYHTDRVRAWLADLGLSDADFRCGPQEPSDRAARDGLIRAGESPCQYHNNCSGKHTGFLTFNQHLGGGPDYIDPDHPVQKAVKATFEEVTGEDSPGFGIDGCSAPNHATSVHGLARAMASFAGAHDRSGARAEGQQALIEAMMAYPELVSGEGKPTTELMRLTAGRAAIKSGADGVYVAIIPELRVGVALKISDGGDIAKAVAMASVLRKLGILPQTDKADAWTRWAITNRNNWVTGEIRATAALA